MKFAILLGSLALSFAGPSSRYEIHQKRDGSSQWIKRDAQLNPRSIIPVSIALSQRNLHRGDEFLMDVSDPLSPNYGKHWSTDKVGISTRLNSSNKKQLVETFASSEATITSVKSWLKDFGIAEERITLSLSRNWLRMNLTIEEAQSLLKTEYREYEHLATSKQSVGCEEYSIPADLRRHIDYVTPTVNTAVISKRSSTRWGGRPKMRPNTDLPPPIVPGKLAKRDSGTNSLGWDISNCVNDMTLACFRALYNMPNGTLQQ
jgi:tripeptidyl-peptidase I